MSQTDLAPVAERLENNLNDDALDARGKVFFAIGFIESNADEETAEALDLLAEYVSEI